MVVAAVLIILLGIVARGFFGPSANAVALFADVYQVPITDESRPIVERYIRGSRSLRMIGVLLGATTMVVVMAASDRSTNATFYLGVGYGLGAVAYELFRRAPGPGSAALVPRRLDDYVNPWINRFLYVTVTFGVFVYMLSFIYETQPREAPSIEVEAYRTIGTLALLGLTLAGVACRRIVQAPEPAISPPVDAAQHAIRTSGLMSLVGLALMAAGIVVIGAVEVGRSDAPAVLGDAVSIIGVPLSIVASMLGFFLTVRSLPRFAPFWRRLPDVEPARGAS